MERRLSSPSAFEAKSADGRFRISLAQDQVDLLIKLCAKTYPIETGGVLVGSYSTDLAHAVVTTVVSPPDDSVGGKHSFRRGVRGLQSLLIRLWPQKQYYVGEWHFHPDGAALPSRADDQQMAEVANSFAYNCPEPLLLIVGGNPPVDVELQSFVFIRGTTSRVHLLRVRSGQQ